ncbi:DNL zinc finger-domain containing protein, partial [Rhodotorula toruloides]
LRITFTCTASVTPEGKTEAEASACGHRSSHEFARRSYEKGVVIIQCPGCGNRHLIADHLHWFSQTPSPAHPTGQPIGSETPRTIEDLMREKGEQV